MFWSADCVANARRTPRGSIALTLPFPPAKKTPHGFDYRASFKLGLLLSRRLPKCFRLPRTVCGEVKSSRRSVFFFFRWAKTLKKTFSPTPPRGTGRRPRGDVEPRDRRRWSLSWDKTWIVTLWMCYQHAPQHLPLTPPPPPRRSWTVDSHTGTHTPAQTHTSTEGGWAVIRCLLTKWLSPCVGWRRGGGGGGKERGASAFPAVICHSTVVTQGTS